MYAVVTTRAAHASLGHIATRVADVLSSMEQAEAACSAQHSAYLASAAACITFLKLFVLCAM